MWSAKTHSDGDKKMNGDKYMLYRIAGNLITFTTLSTILIIMSTNFELVLTKHPELEKLAKIGPRYLTVWNAVIEILYTVLALCCDVSVLLNKKWLIAEDIRQFRYNIFAGLVFPLAFGIVIFFWPMYFYDRRLIFPIEADLTVGLVQNIISHGLILVYAFWELIFIPRDKTRDELGTIKHLFCFSAIYAFVVIYTRFMDLGVWCYEFLNYLEGSWFFHVAFSSPMLFATIGYYSQWYFKHAVWSYRDLKSKVQ